MSSDNAMPKEVLSEQLAELRNSTLTADENIVAQQMGDTGQAVVLTDSRIMILKAGLSATGSIDGRNVTALTFEEVGAVNLRQGPMGAVIQIVGKVKNPDSGVRPPENMAIFSGEMKIRKLEALADKFTSISKLPTNRIGWSPDPSVETYPLADQAQELEPVKSSKTRKPRASRKTAVVEDVPTDAEIPAISEILSITDKLVQVQERSVDEIEFDLSGIGMYEQPVVVKDDVKETKKGRKKKSLAEEIYGEFLESEPEPVAVAQISEPAPVIAESVPVEPVQTVEKLIYKPEIEPIPAIQEEAPVVEPEVVFDLVEEDLVSDKEIYRPNPKLAMYRPKKKRMSMAVALIFTVLILMVLAGVAVLNRNILIDLSSGSSSQMTSSGRKTHSRNRYDVVRYRETIASLVAASDSDSYRLEKALTSRNVSGIRNTISTSSHDKLLRKLHGMQPPKGLQTAQTQLESGVRERKVVATSLSNALSGADTVDAAKTLARLQSADNKVRRALDRVNYMERAY